MGCKSLGVCGQQGGRWGGVRERLAGMGVGESLETVPERLPLCVAPTRPGVPEDPERALHF